MIGLRGIVVIVKAIASKMPTLMRGLTNSGVIGFLHRLPNSGAPLITKKFGLGLLILLLTIIGKFWPDAVTPYLQSGIASPIEPSIEMTETFIPDATIDPAPDVGVSEQPPSALDPTPEATAPASPGQGQSWSKAAKLGLIIVGVSAGLLLGGGAIWYFWPTPSTSLGVMGTIGQAALSNNQLPAR